MKRRQRRPRGGTSSPPPDERTLVAEVAEQAFRAFARCATEIRGADEAASVELRRWTARSVLCLWVARHLPDLLGGSMVHRDVVRVGPPPAEAWTRLATRLGLSSEPALPEWLPHQDLGRVLTRLDHDHAHALASSTVSAIGRVVETLGGLSLVRARAPHVAIGPNDRWLAVDELLRCPPGERAKWVQSAARLPKTAVRPLADPLERARTVEDAIDALRKSSPDRTRVAKAGELIVTTSPDRRRLGAHYTPTALARSVVRRTLAPLLDRCGDDGIVRLRVCDPAVGSGIFLHATAELLADHLVAARGGSVDQGQALTEVIASCLHGVDTDPTAAEMARATLVLAARVQGASDARPPRVLTGNSLVASPAPCPGIVPVDWTLAFPTVMRRDAPGFDAIVGNPPWVAYAGRAAQPLDPGLMQRFLSECPAFAGYRTLHGIFVWKAATLLRPGGRLGFVLPTSVADLAGYAPVRRAHDRLCDVDDDLDDFGDGAFEGVFQPCMALTSTRRVHERDEVSGAAWPLARADLSATDRLLLARLGSLPRLPPHLFGERGLQTTGSDIAKLSPTPLGAESVPLRQGGDISEFHRGPPSVFVNPSELDAKLRPASDYTRVAVLIRQTARFPIAQVSDGLAFRNSILAGFADERWTPHALAAYLNASAIRWYHFMSHRDARQGMPQLKIGHLRALPDIESRWIGALDAWAEKLVARNDGLDADARVELDGIVGDALGFTADEAELVRRWSAAHPQPKPRRRMAK